MKQLVDNVTIQCVEAVLVSNMDQGFSPSQVVEMKNELIEVIASESAASRQDRVVLSRKLTTLESCLSLCKQVTTHRAGTQDISCRLQDMSVNLYWTDNDESIDKVDGYSVRKAPTCYSYMLMG